MPEVRTLKDLEYARTGAKRLLLDLYLPQDAPGPRPVIVWVHGGAWRQGSKENTRAARMTSAVEGTERRQRVDLMLDLARASKERYQSRFLGQALEVLWEGRKNGVWFGLTDNYLRVLTSGPVALANRLLATDLVGHVEGALWGELAIEKHESLASRGTGL